MGRPLRIKFSEKNVDESGSQKEEVALDGQDQTEESEKEEEVALEGQGQTEEADS